MSFIRITLVALAAGLLLGFQGCSSVQDPDTSTPWNVQQPWENTMPIGTP